MLILYVYPPRINLCIAAFDFDRLDAEMIAFIAREMWVIGRIQAFSYGSN